MIWTIWKNEWRHQWFEWSLLLFLTLGIWSMNLFWSDTFHFLSLAIIAVYLILLASVSPFGQDEAKGRLPLILSLPCSRRSWWWMRYAFSLGGFAAPLLGVLYVTGCLFGSIWYLLPFMLLFQQVMLFYAMSGTEKKGLMLIAPFLFLLVNWKLANYLPYLALGLFLLLLAFNDYYWRKRVAYGRRNDFFTWGVTVFFIGLILLTYCF